MEFVEMESFFSEYRSVIKHYENLRHFESLKRIGGYLQTIERTEREDVIYSNILREMGRIYYTMDTQQRNFLKEEHKNMYVVFKTLDDDEYKVKEDHENKCIRQELKPSAMELLRSNFTKQEKRYRGRKPGSKNKKSKTKEVSTPTDSLKEKMDDKPYFGITNQNNE